MSLQIALIILGCAVVIGIYFVSTWHGKYKLTSAIGSRKSDPDLPRELPRDELIMDEGPVMDKMEQTKAHDDQDVPVLDTPILDAPVLTERVYADDYTDEEEIQDDDPAAEPEEEIISPFEEPEQEMNNDPDSSSSHTAESVEESTVPRWEDREVLDEILNRPSEDLGNYQRQSEMIPPELDMDTELQEHEDEEFDQPLELSHVSDSPDETEINESQEESWDREIDEPNPDIDIKMPPVLEQEEELVVDDEQAEAADRFYIPIEPDLGGEDAEGSMPEMEMPDFEYIPSEGFERISQIDYWVKISGERDVGRESVLGIYRDSISGLTKRSNIYGIRLPDKTWCDLEKESEDARFGDLVVTVQLADREGAIEEREMNQFSTLISNLSEGTGRGFAFMAPIESAMEQANAVAAFVRYFDSIFVVNIVPKDGEFFEGSTINRCALQIGLEKSDENYYTRNKLVGKRTVALYTLANMNESGEFDFENIQSSKIKGVTFFTRSCQVRSPGPVFTEMVDTAKAFASRIKGRVITPNQEELSPEDVDIIRRSIEEVAIEMEQHGIMPGSDEAIRIF